MSKKKREKVYIMAIKPKYAKAIYEGKKNWEFRKVPPPILEPIYLYESEPVSAVTGVVYFGVEIRSTPGTVYSFAKNCKSFSCNLPGITEDQLREYTGKGLVSALRVLDSITYDKPIPLKVKPPMNWGRYFLMNADEKGGEK